VLDYYLNIVGSEWIIIIFVALVLILGTNKLPEAAKKLGKAVNEFNKAKNDVEYQMKDFSNHNVEVNGPVQNERQKFEMMVRSFGINPAGKTTEELKEIISTNLNQPPKSDSEDKQ
jgi:sec-independent protein translocase protein TatA